MVKLSPYRQGLRAEHRRWCRSASPIKSGFSLTRFQESELNPCLYELSQLGTVNSCHLPYANNLQKELPRIPHVATFEDFKAFEEAGRKLAELHVNYEQVQPYEGCTISGLEDGADADDLRVTKLKYGKIAGKKGNAALDKTKIVYNDRITISGIPLEVQDYVVNKKSALDWVVERWASQIVNDFNNMAEEMGDPQYILHLILRVITVSLETNKIVASLPALHIHPLDQ